MGMPLERLTLILRIRICQGTNNPPRTIRVTLRILQPIQLTPLIWRHTPRFRHIPPVTLPNSTGTFIHAPRSRPAVIPTPVRSRCILVWSPGRQEVTTSLTPERRLLLLIGVRHQDTSARTAGKGSRGQAVSRYAFPASLRHRPGFDFDGRRTSFWPACRYTSTLTRGRSVSTSRRLACRLAGADLLLMGATAFTCPYEGCGRSFSVLSNMRRHARVHTRGQESQGGADLEDEGESAEEEYTSSASSSPKEHKS